MPFAPQKLIALTLFVSLALVATAFRGAGSPELDSASVGVTGGTAPSGAILGTTELDRALDCQRTGLTALARIPGVMFDRGDAAAFATYCTRSLSLGEKTFGECVARLAQEVGTDIVNETDGTPQAFMDACQLRSDAPYVDCVSELRQRTRFTLSSITEACSREPGSALRGCLERRVGEFQATNSENDHRIANECVIEASAPVAVAQPGHLVGRGLLRKVIR